VAPRAPPHVVPEQTTRDLESELLALFRDGAAPLEVLAREAVDGLWYRSLDDPGREWTSPSFWSKLGHAAPPDDADAGGLSLVHEDDVAHVEQARQALASGVDDPYRVVARYRRGDGSFAWIRTSGGALPSGEHGERRALGTHVDVSPGRRGEDRLRAFIGALPGIALVLDEDGRYIEVMGTREMLLARESSDLVGRLVDDVLPERPARMTMDAIRRAIETDDVVYVEYDLTTLSGNTEWFEGRVVPMSPDPQGAKRHVVWLAHDVTKRKSAELELRRKNEELRQFSYIAGHDLRSPLLAIEQLACWLEEDLATTLDEQSRLHLSLIRRRSERMRRLIGGLLEYARTAECVEPRDVAVAGVVEEAIELAKIPRERFRVVVPDALPTLRTDPILLQLVFQNLIANAIRHHDRDRGEVQIRYERRDGLNVFEVSDDGPGIPEQARERVFQIFQTVTGEGEPGSSGVGLSIVRKAVDALGGSIEVHGDGPRGSIFRITLPG